MYVRWFTLSLFAGLVDLIHTVFVEPFAPVVWVGE